MAGRAYSEIDFSRAFQVYNNLGGMGPIFADPPVIRYGASIADAESPLMSGEQGSGDRLVAFFCGTLRESARASADSTVRQCDPYESVANYQQTASFYMNTDVKLPIDGAQRVAVAWSGRHADQPPDRNGRVLNAGILPGTGEILGEPGFIPNVSRRAILLVRCL